MFYPLTLMTFYSASHSYGLVWVKTRYRVENFTKDYVLREHQHTDGRNLLKGLNKFLSVGTLPTFIVGFEIIYKK
jgi:hypothetical protein